MDTKVKKSLATRRLFLFRGMAGAAAIACATRSDAVLVEAHTATCGLTAEQTVGPYYLDLERVRQDITEGKQGLPLKLRLTVVDATRCLPIENAALDIWHCDAAGVYSGFTANHPDGPPGRRPHGFGDRPPDFPPGPPPRDDPAGRFMPPSGFANRPHDATTFLRGVQLTDRSGVVEFSTIYPGWYVGRAIHIHMRVHVGGASANSIYSGGHISYTGQLFFPENTSDLVAKQGSYATHRVERTLQQEDDVFTTQHGSGSLVTLSQINKRVIEEGFLATSVLGIDPSATSEEMGPGPGGPGRRPPGSRPW